MPTHIVLGSAGCGKTFSLISKVEHEVNMGTPLNRICFCTFSKAAAEEARDRLMLKFNCVKEDLHLCGTIHSICYKKYCADKKVIREKQKKLFFKLQHLNYEIIRTDEDIMANEGDKKIHGNLILDFYDKFRMGSCKDITEIKSERELINVYSKLNITSIEYTDLFSNIFNIYKVLQEYEKYLKENDLIDFAGMLLIAYKNGFTIDADVLVLDEFQDLSPLQFFLYRLWAKDKKDVYISGDPNQTIYIFNLANADFLLNEIRGLDILKGDEEIILPKTFRMASKINTHCSEYINKHMRKDKHIHTNIKPVKQGGEIIEEEIEGDLNKISEFIDPEKSTFILARTNYYKKRIMEDFLIPNGIPYGEIKGQSIWSEKAVAIFNMTLKLVEKKPLNEEEAGLLFEVVPFKFGLMKRGSKVGFKKGSKKVSYEFSDLIAGGFNANFFNFLTYKKIYDILDISDPTKIAFKAAIKEKVILPVKLKISTIHGSKGQEADTVIIFKDISKRIAEEASKSVDAFESEIRVFYVGQSRAREKLVILRGGFSHSERYMIP